MPRRGTLAMSEYILDCFDDSGNSYKVALMLNLKNLGVELPAGALLLSPWVDLACTGDSVAANAAADVMLSPAALEKFT